MLSISFDPGVVMLDKTLYKEVTHQWRRKAWRKADIPSIIHKIATVKMNQNVPDNANAIIPVNPLLSNAGSRIMFHKTSLN